MASVGSMKREVMLQSAKEKTQSEEMKMTLLTTFSKSLVESRYKPVTEWTHRLQAGHCFS